MWIDRIDSRMNEWFEKVPHLQFYLLAAVAVIVVELMAFGWITLGQVEKSHAREASIAAVRANLRACSADAATVQAADSCRARVLASIGPSPAPRRLPTWEPDQSPVVVAGSAANALTAGGFTSSSRGGIVPVSMSSLP